MKIFKFSVRILVMLSTFVITGCATQPIPNSAAVSVPSERVIDSKYLQPIPEGGQVTVKRDGGALGSMCSTRVFINAKPIADIRVSEKVVLYLAYGEYIFSTSSNGICGGGVSELRSSVKVGDELNFRIGYGASGDITISPTAF